MKNPEAVHWNYDFPVVIDGAHLVSEDDYEDFNEDLEPGKDSMWYIQETTKRPKGVCKKVTVLEFD